MREKYTAEVYKLKGNHCYYSRNQLAKNQTHCQQTFTKPLDEYGIDLVYTETDTKQIIIIQYGKVGEVLHIGCHGRGKKRVAEKHLLFLWRRQYLN